MGKDALPGAGARLPAVSLGRDWLSVAPTSSTGMVAAAGTAAWALSTSYLRVIAWVGASLCFIGAGGGVHERFLSSTAQHAVRCGTRVRCLSSGCTFALAVAVPWYSCRRVWLVASG